MTFIIAEIGVNHNNDLKISKQIIDFCSLNKVNAVKFQTFKARSLALKNTPKVSYQKRNRFDSENHFQMLKKLELSKKDHLILKKYCEQKGVEFISTPYDIDSAKFLIDINVNTIKVASADLTDHYLHEFLSKSKKKLIISTGMSNIKNIRETLKIYNSQNYKEITLLHCVSNYPSSIKSLNLNCIDTLKKFNFPVGFSDHSKENLASVIAVAKGATIIEKHITINNNFKGPDHRASLNLKDFKKFINLIRKAELILGTYEKKLQTEEMEMLNISKKSLYYQKNFNLGHKIKKNDLIPMRPFTGFEITEYKKILNKQIIKKVKKNQKVLLSDFLYKK